MYECSTCVKRFTGQVSYDQHIASDKHKKKVSNSALLNSHSGSSTSLTNGATATSLTNGATATSLTNGATAASLMCQVCNLSFISAEELMSHALTKEHALNVMKGNPVNDIVSSSSNIENVIRSAEDEILPGFDDVKKVYSINFSSCDVCGKHFTGPEPYQQHLNSDHHKRKVELQKNAPLAGVSPNALVFCETCKISCSGQIPYIQHVNSAAHKKKLKQQEDVQKYINEVDSSPRSQEKNVHEVASGSINLWFCTICEVQCSGTIPYKQHLEGVNHNKSVKRAELLKNFKPEDSFKTTNSLGGSVNAPQSVAASSEDKKIENCIIPNLFNKPNTVSPEIQKESLTIFTHDEEIKFEDKKEMDAEVAEHGFSCDNNFNESEVENESKDKVDEASGNTGLHIGNASSEVAEKMHADEKKVYRECQVCNVKLYNEDDLASHYESLEHVHKKYGLVRSE